ncbi:MAG: hypothetical protein ABFS34_11440 [Gemmatimonadota bacterium]
MHDDHDGPHEQPEEPLVSDAYRAPPAPGYHAPGGDGNASLALAVGLIAAVAAGVAWALIVLKTGYEIGWIAWGIGLLVGFAMSRLTTARSQGLAVSAAAFAAIGLLVGKLLISSWSAGMLEDAILEDEDWMAQVVIDDMLVERSFSVETLEGYDAAVAAEDTLSDALWERMVSEARTRTATLSDEERAAVASEFARQAIGSLGLVERIQAQMSGWDLLWFFLAVSTAFGMMKASEPEGVAAV